MEILRDLRVKKTQLDLREKKGQEQPPTKMTDGDQTYIENQEYKQLNYFNGVNSLLITSAPGNLTEIESTDGYFLCTRFLDLFCL